MLKSEINTEVEDNKGHRNSGPEYVELCIQDGKGIEERKKQPY